MKFTLNWFKSKKKIVEAAEMVPPTTSPDTTYYPEKQEYKPYVHLKLVNNVITVVTHNGQILSKPNATAEDYVRVKDSRTDWELRQIMGTDKIQEEIAKQEKENARVKAIQNGYALLEKSGDFVVKGNSVYLIGIGRSLPQMLVEQFIEVLSVGGKDTDEYQGLKNFFMWCCLNPRAEVADLLYDFLRKNAFRITKQGFFVALRNVVSVSEDTEIVEYVSNAYNKVKAVWKRNPATYNVWKNEEGEYALRKIFGKDESGEHVGNLHTLYSQLPTMNENRFTDAHTHTFDIRVGKVVNMPPEQCSWSTVDCGEAGLHFTSDQIHYVGCGNTSVLTLINPMKVVGIGQHKGRCWEYLPIMTVPSAEATEILHDLDFDTLQLDEEYAIRELESLAEKAKDGFTKEANKHEFNMPSISSVEIRNIVSSLDAMKKEISQRVKTVG